MIPQHLLEYNVDTPLSQEETERLKKLVEDDLLNMIRDKPDSPEDSYDTFRILNRNIELDLRSEEGKLIHFLNNVVRVLADCLEHDKPAYFSYDTENWGNSNYKGLRKDKWKT